MKKIYTAPETNVMNIHLNQMLASSPTGSDVFDEEADARAAGLSKRDRGDIWGSSNSFSHDWSDAWE